LNGFLGKILVIRIAEECRIAGMDGGAKGPVLRTAADGWLVYGVLAVGKPL
jgi:hypothetical protein